MRSRHRMAPGTPKHGNVGTSAALLLGGWAWVAACIVGCATGGDDPGRDGSMRDVGTADARERDARTADVSCAMTACGAACVDTSTSPDHCGGCGRTCVVPNATAACAAGRCAIGTCAAGFLDCDGMATNGCESPATCRPGEACSTSCGTMGTTSCTSACAPTCTPPAETCNVADDDCDGSCESGLPGCRTAVHRSAGTGHFYTTSRDEAACCGLTVEAYDFFYLSAVPTDGTQPFIRCLAGAYHLYTTDTGCEGAAHEGQMGHILREPRCGAVPLYRLRHPGGDHFYTHSASERDYATTLGYALVGTIGYVFLTP